MPLNDTNITLFGSGGIPANENSGTSIPSPRWYQSVGATPTTGTFNVGDKLINGLPSTGVAFWLCTTASVNGTGAVFSPVIVPGLGTALTSAATEAFGGGTGTFGTQGNINRQVSAAGVVPGGTAADNVLAVYSLPASSFDAAFRGLTISAFGSFAATGNNKRIKIIFNATTAVVGSTVTGGTTVADSGTVATNTGGWVVSGNAFKYGVLGSNTQICTSNGTITGAVHGGITAPALSTAVESAAILIAITGNATTAASDIVFNFLEINAMN